jgi:integrase
MGEVNFYLKKPAKSTGKSLIYLKFKYNNGNALVYTFGQSIEPANWNQDKQRVKSNRQTIENGLNLLNGLLDNLAKVTMKAYNNEIKNGVPEPEKIRSYLDDFLSFTANRKTNNSAPDFMSLIDRFISGEIKFAGKDKSPNTLANYQSTKRHLLAYQEKSKIKVTFDSITLDFFYKYLAFLKTLKGRDGGSFSHNSKAGDIKNIKVFMAEAVDLQYTKNMEFKHRKFSMPEIDVDAVYLSEKEIIDLYNFKIEHKTLEQVKDLFVFGCFVGLRFSDYSTVEKENIVNIDGDLFIKIIPNKTDDLVIIPCNPIVLDIFKKYGNNYNTLPKALSNQKFNHYIKEVCKQAGLVEQGRLSSNPKIELYKCITSHTARRSFATNLYIDGYPIIEIMKITGHKTEKAFLKYIKVSKLDAAKRLNAYMKKKWEEKRVRASDSILRIA